LIPFHTLSQRHLVYAYAAVFCLQFGYAAWLALRWRESAQQHAAEETADHAAKKSNGVR
jgi:hypothetical protein